jgi:hypothetical protein
MVAAAMLGGGVAGAVLGVPGVSAAQETGSTTTNPDSSTDTTTNNSGRDHSNDGTTDRTCPDKDNADSGSGS